VCIILIYNLFQEQEIDITEALGKVKDVLEKRGKDTLLIFFFCFFFVYFHDCMKHLVLAGDAPN